MNLVDQIPFEAIKFCYTWIDICAYSSSFTSVKTKFVTKICTRIRPCLLIVFVQNKNTETCFMQIIGYVGRP